jgi:hypothetical protein
MARYSVTVNVMSSQQYRVEVDADDDDDAREKANSIVANGIAADSEDIHGIETDITGIVGT